MGTGGRPPSPFGVAQPAQDPELPGVAEGMEEALESSANNNGAAAPARGLARWCPCLAGVVNPMELNGVRHSTLTLTSTALGGGALSLSFVMSQAGMILGSIMLILGAILAHLSTKRLMEMSTSTGKHSYAALFSHCAGSGAGPVLDVMLFIYGNGSCVGYFDFLADFIPSIIKLVAPGAAAWLSSRELAIIVCAVLLVPLVLQKDVSALKFITPVSVCAVLYIALVVTCKAPFLYSQHQGDPSYGSVELFQLNFNAVESFSLCVFAFNCHMNVVPVAGKLVRPTRARITKVSSMVNSLQSFLYILIGTMGYLSFEARTQGDIIADYDKTSPFIAFGRVMLSFTLIVAIPMNMLPTVKSALQVRDYFTHASAPSPSDLMSPRESPSASRTELLAPAGASGGHAAKKKECLRVTITLVCLIAQAALAIAVPKVADVLSLLGATVATAMMMAIPAYCMGVILPSTRSIRLQRVVFYLFALLSFSSVPIKLLRSMKVIH